MGMDVLAIITFLAVLVALFGQKFWDWWNRPKIKFSLKNQEPHIIFGYSNPMTKLFRLKVINKGNTVAKNCRIKVLSVFPSPEEKFFEPDILKWSSAPKDTRYTNDQLSPIHKTDKDIHPNGGWEFCDLFFCRSGDSRVNFASSGNRQFLARNDNYIITIEISGDNLKPKKAIFRVSNFQDIFNMKIDWV